MYCSNNENVNKNDHLDQTYIETNLRQDECQRSITTIKNYKDLQNSLKPNNGNTKHHNHELLSPTSNELFKK